MSDTMAEPPNVDVYAEGREVWANFERLAAKMPGYDALKGSRDFAHLAEAREGANLYTYFPLLFLDTFPELGVANLRKLSLVGLFYTYHLTLADALIDHHKDDVPIESILVSNACAMKAHEILAEIFGTAPIPWQSIGRLHRQYSLAMALERRHHYKKLEPYRPRDLIVIISRRFAMAKLIPLAMCTLTNRDEYLKPLFRSFDLYYAAQQLVDDFRDWKEDLRACRYSHLLTDLITGCDLQDRINGAGYHGTIEIIGKHFYLSGRAESYLELVIDHCERARQCVDHIWCPRWHKFLDSFQMHIHVSGSNISKRCRRALLQTDKYRYTLIPENSIEDGATSDGVVLHPVPLVASSVSRAARRAAAFLLSEYKPGIGFEDFLMTRGQLPNWVSGYVGVALLEWAKQAGGGGETSLPRETLGSLAVDLMAKRRDYGWSAVDLAKSRAADRIFVENLIGEDGDTTAWVINLLLSLGDIDRATIDAGIRGLTQYQQPDGGFSTYLERALGPEAAGYTCSHVEVTAAVIEVLLMAGFPAGDKVIRKGLEFIKQRQEPDGLWEAYWWDGQMYSTFHCLLAMQKSGCIPSSESRDRLVERILSMQGEGGSWGDATLGKNESFETALAIKILLLLDSSLAASSEVKQGVVSLLNYQKADGGFNSAPMMRVPEIGEKEPWRIKEWKLDLAVGFGIIARDQNRLFTTATVLSALANILACGGDLLMTTELKPSSARVEPELAATA